MDKRDDIITIDAQGQWWYEGNRIVHPEVLALFRSSLRLGEDGGFMIDYRGKQAPVRVEKTPYFINEIKAHAGEDGNLTRVELTLDDGSREDLDPASLGSDDDGVLRVAIKEGKFAARCLPAAHFRLAELLGEDEDGFFLELGGRCFRVPMS